MPTDCQLPTGMFTNNDIARYYDVSEIHYRRFWNLEKSSSLHFGYWDAYTKNFHEALLNINKILSGRAAIKENDRVLDAGCGIGGSSIWLAANRNCTVTGISLSAKQISRARQLAKKEGFEALVNFEQNDFTATGYPDASFDIVWAIESVCHAADKKLFTDEAFRLLKKGGRLIMADFFKKEGLAGEEALLIQRFANGWAVDDFATIEMYEQQLTASGLTNINIQDITPAIKPSAKRLYRAWFPGAALGFLYRLFHRKATEFGKKNVNAARLQYKCLKKDLWQYYIVLATKSS